MRLIDLLWQLDKNVGAPYHGKEMISCVFSFHRRTDGSVVERDKELATVRALEHQEILPSARPWPPLDFSRHFD